MLRTIKSALLPLSLAVSLAMLLSIPNANAHPAGVNLNIGIGLMLPLTVGYIPPPPPVTSVYPAVTVVQAMPVIVYPVMMPQPKPVHFKPHNKPRHH